MQKVISEMKKKKNGLMSGEQMASFKQDLLEKQEQMRPTLSDTMTEEEKKRMIQEFMARVK